MKKTTIIWLTALAAILFAPLIFAGTLEDILDRGVLRLGTESNYFPFELTDKHGDIIGFDIDIARRMAKTMGVKLEIVNGTVDSVVPGLITKKYDIFIRGLTLTPERNLKINYVNPYFESGQTILIRKELSDKIKSYEDLNDPKYRITSKLGTTGEISTKRYMSQAKYISFETEQEAVLEVLNGRADAFVFDAPYNMVAEKLYGQEKLVHLSKPFTYEPLAWAVRKGDHDYLNWLNNFLNQIKKDGTYDRLYKKWFIDQHWTKELNLNLEQ